MACSNEDVSDWSDPGELVEEQERVAALTPQPWEPPRRPLRVAAAFVAFAAGEQGPGRRGDRGLVGAVLWHEGDAEGPPAVVHSVVVEGAAGDRYVPGLLALREGHMLEHAFRTLMAGSPAADLLLVDATGRDHPRRCGLALHLGWALDVPSVGVTHRLLTDRDLEPPATCPDTRSQSILLADSPEPEAAWVWTASGARPVVAHAAWRTDLDTAVEVSLRTSAGLRTPEPLRQARALAREARSAAG